MSGLSRPLSESDWAAWDKACLASSHSRGLGHEALSEGVPLGWDELVLVAAFPHAALRGPIALAPASAALAEAFGLPSLRVSADASAAPDWGRSWRARQDAIAEAERMAAFDGMRSEDLPTALAQAHGARLLPETFKLSGRS